MAEGEVLYPVVLAVPSSAGKLPVRSRVKFLSHHARKALEISARKSGVRLGDLLKDDSGRPLPFDGIYWSLTHKPGYVGAVVSFERIGIDLEKIEPRRTSALFRKVADPDEWALADSESWSIFHRYWTAKEAVLKVTGIGLADLSKCRIVEVCNHHNLVIAYLNQLWPVEHYYFDGHIASIVKNTEMIKWTRFKRVPAH